MSLNDPPQQKEEEEEEKKNKNKGRDKKYVVYFDEGFGEAVTVTCQ